MKKSKEIKEMLENENLETVSFVAFQELGYNSAWERQKLIRAIIVIVIAFVVAFIINNAIWLFAWTSYDYTSEADTEEKTVTIDSKDGTATYIADNVGDVVNGSNNSQNG